MVRTWTDNAMSTFSSDRIIVHPNQCSNTLFQFVNYMDVLTMQQCAGEKVLGNLKMTCLKRQQCTATKWAKVQFKQKHSELNVSISEIDTGAFLDSSYRYSPTKSFYERHHIFIICLRCQLVYRVSQIIDLVLFCTNGVKERRGLREPKTRFCLQEITNIVTC